MTLQPGNGGIDLDCVCFGYATDEILAHSLSYGLTCFATIDIKEWFELILFSAIIYTFQELSSIQLIPFLLHSHRGKPTVSTQTNSTRMGSWIFLLKM